MNILEVSISGWDNLFKLIKKIFKMFAFWGRDKTP